MLTVNRWSADSELSYTYGRLLQGLSIPPVEHSLINSGRDMVFWSELVFVALCHKTNWDRLHDHIVALVRSNDAFGSPAGLLSLDESDAYSLLADGLDRPREGFSERFRIITEVASSASRWPLRSNGSWFPDGAVLLGGDEGLYARLDEIPAFAEDPLRKKSRVLVHQLLMYGAFAVEDPELIAAAVDHHLIRLYARTGRIVESELPSRSPLQPVSREPQIEANAMRFAVENAMQHTACGAGLRVDEIDFVEWQIGRSFCVSDAPRCNTVPLAEKPVHDVVLRLSKKAGGCPFKKSCPGALDPNVHMLREPPNPGTHY